ncbi:hypothetical protein HDE_06003 [Halotydeus destructor]|nr:hypothetical protein HDE_06003 [Halotydeus destructor]
MSPQALVSNVDFVPAESEVEPVGLVRMVRAAAALKPTNGHRRPNYPAKVENVPAASDFKAMPELEAQATHHGHGHDHHGWLDMGAYSGHHGAFGWYADFPAGHGR